MPLEFGSDKFAQLIKGVGLLVSGRGSNSFDHEAVGVSLPLLNQLNYVVLTLNFVLLLQCQPPLLMIASGYSQWTALSAVAWFSQARVCASACAQFSWP